MAQPSRQQFQEALERKQRERAKDRKADLNVLAQAQVPMVHLTQSKEWDYFLSLIQSKIEEVENTLAAIQEAFTFTPSFDPADMAAQKADMIRLAIQKHTMEAIVSLPAQIIAHGEKAKIALYESEEG